MKRLLPLLTTIAATSFLSLTSFVSPATAQTTLGKNPGELKGRWLRVEDPTLLGNARNFYFGDLSADIRWKKANNENPFDEELLIEKLQQELTPRLQQAGYKKLDRNNQPGPGGILRLDASIEVDPGSRLARYAVGVGVGKSRSVLEIKLTDHRTGREVARYHGYGTGTGLGLKLVGGGARRMTEDDIEENARKLVELLFQVR